MIYDEEIIKKIEELSFFLKSHSLTIATAESITGGLLSAYFTSLSGSSLWYKSSVISYCNEIKQNILKVSKKTIREKTEVSEECVKEMAEGVVSLLSADIGVALSGYAGPGGSDVGKVCFGVCIKGKNTYTLTKHYPKTWDRNEIREMCVCDAVDFTLQNLYKFSFT